MGCVTQIGEQGWNIGRMAPLVAGWPETVCGTTVDRQCGSSMQTNFNAAAAIWSGQADVVVSAGVEMMSRVPMGSNGGDLSDKLTDRWQIVPQGISAEAIAEEWGLSREDLDEYSLESHRRAVAAIDEGRFEREIVPVEVEQPARRRARRRGRDAEARHVRGEARVAAACLPSRRQGHRRQLEPDLRRRGRGADHLRGCCGATRARAARAVRLLRARRRRPLPDAPRQPRGVRERSSPGRPLVGRHRGHRGQRGVRLGRSPVPEGHRASRTAAQTSTRTAAGSRSAIRSAPPAHG